MHRAPLEHEGASRDPLPVEAHSEDGGLPADFRPLREVRAGRAGASVARIEALCRPWRGYSRFLERTGDAAERAREAA